MSEIDTFLPSWQHARGLTRDFIDVVPANRWDWSPDPRYGALSKQFRHMICVQGVYVDGLRRGVADFSSKHSHYGGTLGRAELLVGLSRMDDALIEALDSIREQGEDGWMIEFYGQQPLGTYLNTFLHHEALHHGQWSFYATLGGFETPESWKLNWGL